MEVQLRKNNKIFVAGHNGMVGSAIVRLLLKRGYSNIVTKSRAELDLIDQKAVNDFFNSENIEIVILAAAKVGGIMANQNFPAEFLYQNLMIESNVIHAAYCFGVNRLLFLGSSCIYPKLASQPIKESELLSGYLEPTNEPYALAKITGIKLCETYNRQFHTDYRSIMPSNLYGPGDNFDIKNSHVLPALIRKLTDAKLNNKPEINLWGTGQAKREFLHVDDLASASLHTLELTKTKFRAVFNNENQQHINIGSGEEIRISELAIKIATLVGYTGRIKWDASFPDGTPRKLVDATLITQLGWTPSISLDTGLKSTYEWYTNNIGLLSS